MNDTCFGINNEGQLVFDYYHEDHDTLDGANVYNGQNSTLWTNFREAYADEIKETYQKLRGDGLITYDILEEQFITKGSDKWSESVFNEDGEFKYVSMVKTDGDASKLSFLRGDGEQHFRYFIENRLNYCDSKWYATDYANDFVSLRIYTPTDANGNPRTDLAVAANADITVIPYSNMYAGVRYKANGTLYQERVEHGEEITFEAPDETFNDTETAIYGASQLSSLGDLAPLYCGTVDVSSATKLTEIKIGDGTTGYANNNLKELSVGTNKLLKKIDIQNCPSFTSALGLAGCQNIEEIYAKGSGITGIELADSGYLKIVQLPATIANLTIKNQEYIEEFSMEGYSALKTMQVENCPAIDTLSILDNATNLERVRLTGVDWEYDDVSFLHELKARNLAGIDENGANTDIMWLDGKCHIKTLTGTEMAELKTMFPYLTITYDNLTSNLIFMSEDGKTELCRQTISNGGNGTDPVNAGTITAPTKESTAQFNFTFSGWSLTPGGNANDNALTNVESDRYVYASFSDELRYYTVNFYIESELKETYSTPYMGTATFVGSTAHPTDPDIFEFVEWKPSPVNITGDTNCYAQYYDTREIQDDWATIATNCNNCTATSKYAIGSYKNVEINYEDGTSEIIPMEVIAHNHDELTDRVMKWEQLESVSFDINGAIVINYSNKMHMLVGSKHHKYDVVNWLDGHLKWYSDVSTLPYDLTGCKAVLYKDPNHELHVLGGNNGITNHYKWNGSTWTSVSTLPIELTEAGEAVVYNNEIHIMSGSDHYKWNGSKWTQVTTGYTFDKTKAVVHDGSLYVLGGNNTFSSNSMYRFNAQSNTWDMACSLPRNACVHIVVSHNKMIHVLGDSVNKKSYYTWNGSEWSDISVMPLNSNPVTGIVSDNEINLFCEDKSHYKLAFKTWVIKSAAVGGHVQVNLFTYKNELYGFNSSKVYKWNGESWETSTISTPPHDGIPLILNDELHVIAKNGTTHSKWNGTEWSTVSTLPASCSGGNAVVLNNEIHAMCETSHYKWDGTEWTLVSTLPKTAKEQYNGFHTVVYNNEIYCNIFYSYSGNQWHLLKYNGSEWIDLGEMPLIFRGGCMIVHDGKIHFIGTNNSMIAPHYTFDGSTFENVSTIPFATNGYKMAISHQGKLYHYSHNKGLYVLENPKATLTFFAKNMLSYLPSTRTSNDGWNDSSLRTWCNNDLLNSLPSDLQGVISPVNKASNRTKVDEIIITQDKLWFVSGDELGATSTVHLHGQGSVYPVFTDNESKNRYDVDRIHSGYWTRSAQKSQAGIWLHWTGGLYNHYLSNNLHGICFGFCI